MSTAGLITLEDTSGIDFPALRAARRARVFAEMDARGADVLMLGRQANARYLVGHRPIWRAVVTAWGPFAVAIRDGEDVHLLHTTWDDGVPSEVAHDHITGLTWNPRTIVANVASVPGLRGAKSIAVDGMSAGMAALIGHLAPDAQLIDGEELMRSARLVKLPEEVECIRMSAALTEGALTAALATLRPGVEERSVKAEYHRALTAYGVNHPNLEGVFCGQPPDGTFFRQLPTERTIGAGELVAASGAVPYAGYEAAVARTWPCLGPTGSPSARQHALHDRSQAALDAVIDECRPGRTGADVVKAWTSTGEPLPPVPLVHGLGLGVEAVVNGDDPIVEGMVLAVQGVVFAAGVGAYYSGDTVHVTAGGPVRLTRLRAPITAFL
jgi:Xaa-Pro aminopeptidase